MSEGSNRYSYGAHVPVPAARPPVSAPVPAARPPVPASVPPSPVPAPGPVSEPEPVSESVPPVNSSVSADIASVSSDSSVDSASELEFEDYPEDDGVNFPEYDQGLGSEVQATPDDDDEGITHVPDEVRRDAESSLLPIQRQMSESLRGAADSSVQKQVVESRRGVSKPRARKPSSSERASDAEAVCSLQRVNRAAVMQARAHVVDAQSNTEAVNVCLLALFPDVPVPDRLRGMVDKFRNELRRILASSDVDGITAQVNHVASMERRTQEMLRQVQLGMLYLLGDRMNYDVGQAPSDPSRVNFLWPGYDLLYGRLSSQIAQFVSEQRAIEGREYDKQRYGK